MFYSFSTKLERKFTPRTELLLSSLAVKNKKTFSQVVLIKGLRKQGIYTYVNLSVAVFPVLERRYLVFLFLGMTTSWVWTHGSWLPFNGDSISKYWRFVVSWLPGDLDDRSTESGHWAKRNSDLSEPYLTLGKGVSLLESYAVFCHVFKIPPLLSLSKHIAFIAYQKLKAFLSKLKKNLSFFELSLLYFKVSLRTNRRNELLFFFCLFVFFTC